MKTKSFTNYNTITSQLNCVMLALLVLDRDPPKGARSEGKSLWLRKCAEMLNRQIAGFHINGHISEALQSFISSSTLTLLPVQLALAEELAKELERIADAHEYGSTLLPSETLSRALESALNDLIPHFQEVQEAY